MLVGLVCAAIAFASLAAACLAERPRPLSTLAVQTEFFLHFTPCKTTRVYNFPEQYSLGEFIVSPDYTTSEDDSLKGAAKGKIIVPPGRFVTFIPAHHFYQNPGIVSTFPPDGVDRLCILAEAMDTSEEGFCDRAMKYATRLKSVVELKLDRSDTSDDGVAWAKDLPNLQRISAFSCSFEGKCFKHLAGHPGLRCIRLNSGCIKDENLQYLRDIPHLENLNISHSSLSDNGINNLAGCKSLINLDMCDNPKVTDGCLKTLLTLKSLRSLTLGGTAMTNEAAMKLKVLPLLFLQLPQPEYEASKIQALRQYFKGVIITFKKTAVQKLDADTKSLFAPLH